jgi:DNA-binding NarL/FixJ family response regulator
MRSYLTPCRNEGIGTCQFHNGTRGRSNLNQKLRVCVLSDNRLFRESLGRILAKRSDFEVSVCQEISEGACEEALQTAVDVVLLDSVDFLISNSHRLKLRINTHGTTKVLLVAMDEDEKLFLRAVRAGALGFIPKDASAMDVVAAVRSVARGEAVCPARLCKFLFDYVMHSENRVRSAPSRAVMGLTRRERQLIPLIDRGLTNKEIASHLNLSEKTIKNHIHRILRKVGAENRMSLSEACRGSDLEEGREAATSSLGL